MSSNCSGSSLDITSIRIVSVDNYMRYPIPNLDPLYSDFRGNEVKQVH